MPDAINPDHYKRLDPEPLAVIERWDLSFHLGQVIKYVARAGYKPGAPAAIDLGKARFYLDRAIQLIDRDAGTELAQVADRELLAELEHERAESTRWKITARALADRVRELTTQDRG